MSVRRKLLRGLKLLITGQQIKRVYPQIVTLPHNRLLEGRTALVTGGTSGIGKEIARSFVNAGASVIITGRSIQRIEESCEEIKNPH